MKDIKNSFCELEKDIDEMPFKCPMYQCGGIMKSIERKYPKGKNEDDFPDGMIGDFQIPDLICTNCKAIYSFTKFKGKRTKNELSR
jgi:hypothetical protein